MNPLQQSSGLPSELKDRKNKIIKVRIGSPLTVKEQSSFGDLSLYGQYLRASPYAPGSPYEKGYKGNMRGSRNVLTAEPLAHQVSSDLLMEEY